QVLGGVKKRRDQIGVGVEPIVERLLLAVGAVHEVALPPVVARLAVGARLQAGVAQEHHLLELCGVLAGDDRDAIQGIGTSTTDALPASPALSQISPALSEANASARSRSTGNIRYTTVSPSRLSSCTQKSASVTRMPDGRPFQYISTQMLPVRSHRCVSD